GYYHTEQPTPIIRIFLWRRSHTTTLRICGSLACWAWSLLTLVWFGGEQADELGGHAAQLAFALGSDVEHTRATTDDLASPAWPGERQRVSGALGDLLNPAAQCDVGAIDVAPVVVRGVRWFGGHGHLSWAGVAVPG